jgi:hypothetical protein
VPQPLYLLPTLIIASRPLAMKPLNSRLTASTRVWPCCHRQAGRERTGVGGWLYTLCMQLLEHSRTC